MLLARPLLQALLDNTALERLCLSGNPLGDEGAEVLAAALAVNTSLRSLSLSECFIGRRGLSALADVLEDNSTLLECDVRFNRPAGPLAHHELEAIAAACCENRARAAATAPPATQRGAAGATGAAAAAGAGRAGEGQGPAACVPAPLRETAAVALVRAARSRHLGAAEATVALRVLEGDPRLWAAVGVKDKLARRLSPRQALGLSPAGVDDLSPQSGVGAPACSCEGLAH